MRVLLVLVFCMHSAKSFSSTAIDNILGLWTVERCSYSGKADRLSATELSRSQVQLLTGLPSRIESINITTSDFDYFGDNFSLTWKTNGEVAGRGTSFTRIDEGSIALDGGIFGALSPKDYVRSYSTNAGYVYEKRNSGTFIRGLGRLKTSVDAEFTLLSDNEARITKKFVTASSRLDMQYSCDLSR